MLVTSTPQTRRNDFWKIYRNIYAENIMGIVRVEIFLYNRRRLG